MVKTGTEQKRAIKKMLKNETEIYLAVENHQGVRSHGMGEI